MFQTTSSKVWNPPLDDLHNIVEMHNRICIVVISVHCCGVFSVHNADMSFEAHID